MRNILILAGLSVAAIAGGMQLRATLKASEARAATAAAWSGDTAQFVSQSGVGAEHVYLRFR
jgi:hypothetical protein